MALIICPECEKQISNEAQICPHCGFPIQKRIAEWDIEENKQKENEEFLDSLNYINTKKKPARKKPKKKKTKSYGCLIFLITVVTTVLIIAINTSGDKNSAPSTYTTKQAPKKYTPKVQIKYTTAYVNVRKRASTNSKILKTLKPNVAIKTDGSNVGGFTEILDDKTNRFYGWCSTKYLQNSPLSQSQLDEIKQKQIEAEKRRENAKTKASEKKSNNTYTNRYVVAEEQIMAATTKENYDIMWNCILSNDAQALRNMYLGGQLILLNKNEVVFLVKARFGHYIIRRPGSTTQLYVNGEQLKRQ